MPLLNMSKDRVSQIDSDFMDARRQEIIDYAVRKYGRDSVCQIITYGQMGARGSIRAVGRAYGKQLGISPKVIDQLAKLVPAEPNIKLNAALARIPDLRHKYDTHEAIKELIDISMAVEGLTLYTSTHAAGVLITDRAGVTEHVPVWNNDGSIVAQYDMGILEDLGMLKMDFLGLKTLGILHQAIQWAKKIYGAEVNFKDLYKTTDLAPIALLRQGLTAGIFQVEGEAMTNFIKNLQPENMEEWIAAISLYRPGPMDFIPDYLRNRKDPESIRYPFPELKPILEQTYGILCYQEQTMMTVVEVAGYDRSDSDSFRKVVAKKKENLIPLHRKWFVKGRDSVDLDEYGKKKDYGHPIPGGVERGHDQKELEDFFSTMEDFGKYAFNKSHAACYAVLGYACAYMKYYYPAAFMAALLNHWQGNHDKTSRYITHCKQDLGIEVNPPKINDSREIFVPLDPKVIAYSLNAKNASQSSLKGLFDEREANGPYRDFEELILRGMNAGIEKGTVEALASIGALEELGVKRSQILSNLDKIMDRISKTKQAIKRAEKSKREIDVAKWMNINQFIHPLEEIPDTVCWALEKKFMGSYLTGHPLHKHLYAVQEKSDFKLSEISYDVDEESGMILSNPEARNGRKVRFIGLITEVKITVTRAKKEKMAILTVADLTGSSKMLVWPQIYERYEDLIQEDMVLDMRATIKSEEDEPPVLICDSFDKVNSMEGVERLIVRPKSHKELTEFVDEISKDPMKRGNTPMYIEYNNIRMLIRRTHWVNLENIDLSQIDSVVITQ